MDDASPGPVPREWDAGSYHAVATPHQAWGAEILDRLPLRGDETVLDLGCGTGRVSAQLLERLGANGRVIGVDGSAAMVAEATRLLGGERARFVQQDLLELTVEAPADAAVSSATFHWIADHDRLFARIRAAIKDGAPFVAQCGGRGNVASIVAVVREVAAREPFAATFAGWPGPWNFAGPEETSERLERAGFAVERVWLNESPQRPPQTREFLRTV
jgi:trans-aconitate 2-methyltransferase